MAREANACGRAGNGTSRRSASVEEDAPIDDRESGGSARPDDTRESDGSQKPGVHRRSHEQRERLGSREAGDERATLPLYVRCRGPGLWRGLRAACFWTAIVLPFLYVPLLVAGIETRSEGVVLLALLALNAVSLLAGHSYRS
ncbi:hypothetical protein BRC86_01450 [Halobacteriales archaeon QS_3_64_16]|nr:MAG: hypothetical protein BRC86_01450 [Halobacteriales archaeon QS_3_64_16]